MNSVFGTKSDRSVIDRRTVLHATLFASLSLSAGCLSESQASDATEQPSYSPTETPVDELDTRTGTPTRTEYPTRNCTEQPIMEDVRVINDSPNTTRVTFELRDSEGEQLFRERYTVPAGEEVSEEERIFEGTDESETYVFVVTVDGETKQREINNRALIRPTLYGYVVEVRDDEFVVKDVHLDPSEAFNPNCYG